jgi:hypothetical protein
MVSAGTFVDPKIRDDQKDKNLEQFLDRGKY